MATDNYHTADTVSQMSRATVGSMKTFNPQKKLKKSIEMHARAPLAGPGRHFINEIEIHPGYYVDWDATPDDTLEPLGRAYGEYLVRLLTDKRAEGAR